MSPASCIQGPAVRLLWSDGIKEEKIETAAASPAASWKPEFPNSSHTPHKQKGLKDINWAEIRCHNCSGLGHMKRNCPSPKKMTRTQTSAASPESPKSAVLHLKAQRQEMSIRVLVHELEGVCCFGQWGM